jgi:AraC-like DNA-binding protein
MPHPRTLRTLLRVRDLVRDCYSQELTLADLSAEADVSAGHLLRAFRSTFGETPHEFLTRLRLDRAKHLLTVTGRSVTEICFEVGFQSLGSFSTLFRRHVGVSPAEFRRRIRPFVTVPGRHPWGFIPMCFAQLYGPAAGTRQAPWVYGKFPG